MRKLILFLILLILLGACSKRKVNVTGNLDKPLKLNKPVNLSVFSRDEIPGAKHALLIGSDGTAVFVPKKSFAYLDIDKHKGKWEVKADNTLPPVCNITDIEEICFYKTYSNYELYVLNNNKTEKRITPFRARKNEFLLIGNSIKNEILVSKFTRENNYSLPLENDSTLIIFKNGTEKLSSMEDIIELDNFYFSLEGDTLSAIWKNPPSINLSLIHDKVVDELKMKRVLLILIDGLGWSFWQHPGMNITTSFLHDKNIEPLRIPYPPLTRNSLWSLGTGGRVRSKKKPEDEYFIQISQVSTNPLIIEGDVILYSSPITQLAMLDKNNNGSSDDEIYLQAVQSINGEHDFIFLNFHHLDEIDHELGAYSEERVKYFRVLEDYISILTTLWSGSVYLISDHGMHNDKIGNTNYKATTENLLGIWSKLK